MHRPPHPSVLLVVALAVVGLGPAPPAAAQPSFVEVSPTADPLWVTPADEDFWINAVAPADVDGDGDLDLAVLGFYVVYFVSAEDMLVLFLNDGEGAGGEWNFTTVQVPLGDVFAGSSDLAWGDFDGDGDHDLAVGSEGRTVVYANDGGNLTALAGELPGYAEDSGYTGAYDLRSITWADTDNDGDLDLLVPSVFDQDEFTFHTVLLRNDGPDGAGGWLFTDAGAALDPTVHAQSAWADDDGDEDLDLFLVNVDPYLDTGFIGRYRNDGGGTFSGETLLELGVEYGLADWGDYDADGDLDVLVAGNVHEVDDTYNTVLRVYRNDAGVYAEDTLIDAPDAGWLDLHAATWADYDSDGDVDLLVTGNRVGDGEIVGKSEIYGNDSGAFTALGVELPAPVESVGRGGAFTWFDLDGDGDLDYLVAGAYFVPGGNGLVEAMIHLYRNGPPAGNDPPGPPGGLVAAPQDDGVVLSWSPAADDHTPSAALTYDLELRPAGQPAPAARRLPEPGGVGSATAWSLAGLAPGVYAWSVAAVDGAFAGGPRAEGTFTVGSETIFADGFESGGTGAWSAAVP
jgi:hypothetical protein